MVVPIVLLEGKYILSNMKVLRVTGGGIFRDGQWYLASGMVVLIVLLGPKVPSLKFEGTMSYTRWYLQGLIVVPRI